MATDSSDVNRVTVLTVSIGLAFLSGATINWLPVTYAHFEREFAAGLQAQGSTWGLFFVGGIVIAALGGWLTKSLGLKRAASGTLLVLGLGMSIVGGAPLFGVLLIGCFLFGMGMNWMTIVYSTLISSHFQERRQSLFLWANAALSGGSFLTLPLLGIWFEHTEYTGGWRSAYLGLGAGAILGGGLLLWLCSSLDPVATPEEETGAKKDSGLKSLMGQGGFWLIGLCFFLYAMAQLAICSWVGQLYRYRLSIDDAQAGSLLGFNSLGYLIGLLILSWLSSRRNYNDRLLLAACCGSATVVLIGVILSQEYTLGLVLMTLEGATIAGSGPAIFSFVGARFQKEGALAFALLVGFSQVGASAGPYSVGFLGERLGGLETAIWIVPFLSAVVALLSLTWEFGDRKRRGKAQGAA